MAGGNRGAGLLESGHAHLSARSRSCASSSTCYLETGKPVGSRAIAERRDFDWGPSTVRAELGGARGRGLPDPSAHLGRPGADRRRLPALRRRAARRPSRAARGRGGRARALADAPRGRRGDAGDDRRARPGQRPAGARHRAAAASTATIHRVEVLRLQPQVVVVVAIASTGDVAKRVFTFERRRRPRPGRVGVQLPERAARRARRRLADDRRPPRRPRARQSESALPRPASRAAFTELERDAGQRALRGRAPRACSPRARRRHARTSTALMTRARGPRQRARGAALGARRALGLPLDRRGEPAAGAALGQRGQRQLRARLPQPRRGRRRRPAADGLRDRDRLGPRRRARAVPLLRDGLRGADAMPRDYYEVLGVDRGADEAEIKKAFRAPRPRAAPRRQQPRPRGGGEVQGGGRGLRGPLRRRAAPHLRRLRPRGPALGRLVPAQRRASARSRTSSRRSSAAATAVFGFGARAARPRGGDVGVAVEIDLADVLAGVTARSASTPSAPASTATATAPSPARRSAPASAAAAPASCAR